MAPTPSSSEAASQALQLANMTDVVTLCVGDPAQRFTIHTSLLVQSSKWFQEREQTLTSAGGPASNPSSENIAPSTIQIPLPHTPGAVSIFVQYLYQKDVIPHTSTFTKHAIEAYHLSRFLESADFTRCCERAIEHAIFRGSLKPSLLDLQGLLKYDASNPVRTQVFNNLVHRITKREYEYNSDDTLVNASTWKAIWFAAGEKAGDIKRSAAVDETDNKDGHHNTTNNDSSNTVTTGGLFGRPQPQPSGGLFGSNQTQQRPSGSPFGTFLPNNPTSNGCFGASVHSGSLFGNPSHRPPSTSGGLFNASQAQPNFSAGLFGNSRPNATTGGLFGNTNPNPPQSSSVLFGNPLNNTTKTQGLFGSRPTQSENMNNLFGNKPTNAAPGGLFGNTNHPQSQTSCCLLGGNSANTTDRNDSNNVGLFGHNQGQNRLLDGFGNCKPSVSIFGQTNPPSTFRSNVHAGGFGAPTTTWASTYKPTSAQDASNNTSSGGFGWRPTESGFKTDHDVYKSGTTAVPYRPFIEKDAYGNINVYNHISCTSPFVNFSNEELRLADYKNGLQSGNLRPQWVPAEMQTQPQTGHSQSIFESLPSQQACIPLRKLNPAAELEQLSLQVASQKTELEALRAKIDGGGQSDSKSGGGKVSAEPTNPGRKTIPWDEGAKNCLIGLNLVFTGRLQSLDRDVAIRLVEKYGAKTSPKPSRKTNFVVLGDNVEPKKLEVTRILDIKTIDEDQLFHLIRCLPANGGDDEVAKTDTISEGKQTIEEMTTLMCIFEKKLSLVEKETETLKKRLEAHGKLLAAGCLTDSDSMNNNDKEVDDEKEKLARSTPINIFTPASSATASPSPTFGPATATVEIDDFVNINSSSTSKIPTHTCRHNDATSAYIVDSKPNTNTTARDQTLDLSPAARALLAYLRDVYRSSTFFFDEGDREIKHSLDLSPLEVDHAVQELSANGLLYYDPKAFRYSWGRK